MNQRGNSCGCSRTAKSQKADASIAVKRKQVPCGNAEESACSNAKSKCGCAQPSQNKESPKRDLKYKSK
ncbi:UNVERIFIED_CONTAM: hypothetical protein PYX00_009014 [Menopon gallinae]|uniref:Metallothionein n=1 Tax=Menopon gallinae TaxID=328185 RepID=A0AAW2H9K4_9NEOP